MGVLLSRCYCHLNGTAIQPVGFTIQLDGGTGVRSTGASAAQLIDTTLPLRCCYYYPVFLTFYYYPVGVVTQMALASVIQSFRYLTSAAATQPVLSLAYPVMVLVITAGATVIPLMLEIDHSAALLAIQLHAHALLAV